MNEFVTRTKQSALLIVNTRCTIRQAAKQLGRSKSTVHKDLNKILPNIDQELYEQVKEILEYNFKVKHIRGGESTKRYYEIKKMLKNSCL